MSASKRSLRAARATKKTAVATAMKLRNPCQLSAKPVPPLMLGLNGMGMARSWSNGIFLGRGSGPVVVVVAGG